MAIADTQVLQFLCYPVGFRVARQGAYLNLVKGATIACCLDNSDITDVLGLQVLLHPLCILLIRKGTDLQV